VENWAAIMHVLNVEGPGHEVRAWRPGGAGVREVLHARFAEHGYPPHTHATWTVLVVDAGAISYALDRRAHGTVGTDVTVLPPHVVHDGRPAGAAGFVKRVLYLEPGVLPDELIGRAVDRPTIRDAALRRAIGALHDGLAPGSRVAARPGTGPDTFDADTLDADSRLALVAERLAGWLARRRPPAAAAVPGSARRRLASALRDLMDADVAGGVVLADAARELGADPAVLVRAFSATFGITPHAYLVARRLELARDLLLDGVRPAAAATEAGFYDQAHLTRHFRRFLATTPGRFAPPFPRDRL
jgi:AraC-like DNA-binding protein